MKILWHMPTLRSRACGLSKRAVRLAGELIAFGHDVTFLVRRGCTDLATSRIDGIPVRTVDVTAMTPIHWSLQGLARSAMAELAVQQIDAPRDLFISCQPEIVTAYRNEFPNRPLLFVCGGTTILHDAADGARRPHRSPVTRFAFGVDAFVKHRNEKRAYQGAHAVVFDSESTRSAVIAAYGIAPEKCHAIYGGTDTAEFYPPSVAERLSARLSLGMCDSDRVITWTGRLSPEKNVACLIEAVAKCRTHGIKALIVGDGPDKGGLQCLAGELHIADRVHFVGECGDVRPYLLAADAFAFPSIGESFGGSLAEAMACGLPCIALRGDGRTMRNASAEILDNGACGILVDRNEPGMFAAGIDTLFDDASLRQTLGAAAALRAKALFTWSSAGHRLRDLVVRLSAMRRKSNAAQKKTWPSARVEVESIFG